MPKTWKDVAEAVTERRKILMMTQQQAASASNVSATTWQKLEVRHEAPSERTLRKMARVLGWPPNFAEELLEGRVPASEPMLDLRNPGDIAPVRGGGPEDPFTELVMRVQKLERQAARHQEQLLRARGDIDQLDENIEALAQGFVEVADHLDDFSYPSVESLGERDARRLLANLSPEQRAKVQADLEAGNFGQAASEPGGDPALSPTDEGPRPRPPAVDPDDVAG